MRSRRTHGGPDGGTFGLWYWRQVLAIVATTVVRDVRAHPILTIRGIALALLLLRTIVRRVYYVVRFDEVLFSEASDGSTSTVTVYLVGCRDRSR